jgi:hypothetical protein
MGIKSNRDFCAGLIFLGIGSAFAFGAMNYSFGSSARPGPGYLPFGLGIMLALLGLIVTVKSLVVPTSDGEPVGQIAWRPLLIVLGSLTLFALLLPRAGMVISLPVLVITSAWAGDEFHFGEALANAAIMTTGAWLIFIKGLGLAIPLLPVFLLD